MLGALIGILIYVAIVMVEVASTPYTARRVEYWIAGIFMLFGMASLGGIIQVIITELGS